MAQSFQLKGSLFTLSVLHLLDTDLELLDQQLAEKVNLAPKFFQHAPVVIDLHHPTLQHNQLNLAKLITILQKHTLVPVGICGGSSALQTQAQSVGLAILLDSTSPDYKVKKTKQPPLNPQATLSHEATTLLVTQPIRSGQQVYSQGDLIVIASVSPGAELLAEGNIHIYGSLRGRALAGVSGNSMARIFCHRNEAELIAIAGTYMAMEEIDPISHTPQQIYLEAGKLITRPL